MHEMEMAGVVKGYQQQQEKKERASSVRSD